jgi:group I intron endonuclease
MEEVVSGIYKITSPSGRVYIGRAVNVEKRFREYKEMRSKIKGQVRLWRSFLKYGTDLHTFETIEVCERLHLNIRERHWQEFYKVLGEGGLNCIIYKIANFDAGISEETRQKLREATSGKNNPRYGVKYSPELKKKLSDAAKGKYVGSKNPMYGKVGAMKGKKHTEETLKKMSLSQSGGGNPSARLVLDTATGIFYSCLRDASEAINKNRYTLANRLGGFLKNNTTLIYC